MKSPTYFILVLSILFFGFINPHPLVPSRSQKQHAASSYVIERKGMSYSAGRIEGSITRPLAQTNSYFLLSADFVGNGKNITVAIYFRNQDDLIVGKPYSLSGNGNLAKDSRKPRTILYVEFESNAQNALKTITTGSESGTLVFSAINIAGKKAIVSGRFDFKGKNDNSKGDENEVSIKGRFTNVAIEFNASKTPNK